MRHGLALLLCSLSSQAWASDLSSDVRLTKTISVRDKIVSLEAFGKEMTQKVGIPVLISPKLLDMKITAICSNRPAAEIMDRLATLFQFQWQKEKDGYRLVEPSDLARDERDLMDKEEKLARASAQAYVDAWMEDSKRTFDEITREVESLKLEAKGLEDDLRPAAAKRKAEIAGRLRRIERYASNRISYDAGVILRQMDKRAWDRFWAGKTIVGSTMADAAPYKIDSDAVSSSIRMVTEKGEEKPTGAFLFMRYKPSAGIEMQSQVVFKSNIGSGKVGDSTPRFDKPSADALAKHPFRVRWQEWVTPVSGDVPLFRKKFPADAKTRSLKSPYFNSLIPFSDHLEYLADSTGTPVIADAFRLPISYEEDEAPAENLGTWVQKWSRTRSIGFQSLPGGLFHVEGDWLLYRHAQFWQLKAAEIPEKVLEPIESRKTLTVDDYATLVAKLTPAQEDSLSDDWWVLTRFSAMPVAEAGPALRVWAAMSNQQKQAATSDQGILVTALGSVSQGLYWDALLESMWRTIIMTERVRSALARGSDPELEGQMKLFYLADTKVFLRPDGPAKPTPGQESFGWSTTRMDGSQFLFGPDTSSSSTYQFRLVPPKIAKT